MASVGKLVVELAASTAQFQADMGKAAKAAEDSSKRIGVAFSFAKGVIGSLAGAVSVGTFVNLIKGSIDAQDHLNDLAKSTQVSVEQLGGLGFAAQQSGSSLDGIAKAFGKFNLQVAEAAGGNEEAIQNFKDLGITLTQLKTLSVDELFLKTADAFRSFDDSANKAALGNAIFKKAYQEIIPTLDEGGAKLRQQIEYFRKYSGVTKETAQQSDEFNDTMTKIHLLSGRFATTLAAELLPSLQTLAERFSGAQEKGTAFKTAAADIATVLKGAAVAGVYLASVTAALGQSLGGLAAQAAAAARLDFKRVGTIADEMAADGRQRVKDFEAFRDAILNPQAAQGGGSVAQPPAGGKNAPGRGKVGAAAQAADAAKAALAGQLRELDRFIRSEEDALNTREQYLQDYYQHDELGLKQYFEARQDTIDEGLRKTVGALNKELDALDAARARAKTPRDREDIDNKIAETIDRRALAEQKASEKSVRAFIEQKRAAEDFRNKVEEIGIQLAELNGNPNAAGARFDFANKALQDRINLEKDSDDESLQRQAAIAQRALDGLRKRTVQQDQLNKKQEQFSDIAEELANAQARVDLQVSGGQITSLDGLAKKSDLASQYAERLKAVADAFGVIARESGDPKALAALDALKLKAEEVAASTDALAKTFRDIFVGSFTDAITEAVTGTKSLKDAFKDMERSIVQSISRIAAQNIGEAIFGKGGSGSGFVGLFSKLFGGGAAAGGASAIDLGAFFADGGSPPVGKVSVVGERGPELFVPKVAGTIVPNEVFRGGKRGNVYHMPISVNVPGSTSRASADQIATATGAAVARALRRNS
jgi:pimeloyl-ACP methyl ester carboxylesterase